MIKNCIVVKIIIKKILLTKKQRWYENVDIEMYINSILHINMKLSIIPIWYRRHTKYEWKTFIRTIIKLMMQKLCGIYLKNVGNIENSLSQWKNMSTSILFVLNRNILNCESGRHTIFSYSIYKRVNIDLFLYSLTFLSTSLFQSFTFIELIEKYFWILGQRTHTHEHISLTWDKEMK